MNDVIYRFLRGGPLDQDIVFFNYEGDNFHGEVLSEGLANTLRRYGSPLPTGVIDHGWQTVDFVRLSPRPSPHS